LGILDILYDFLHLNPQYPTDNLYKMQYIGGIIGMTPDVGASIRALNVTTAQIVTMVRETFE